MGYILTTAATTYPITLATLKEHLRLPSTYTDEDERLNFFIQAATGMAEKYTCRILMESTWQLILNSFPKIIEFGRAPVLSVVEITYKDESFVERTIPANNYELVNSEEPPYIIPISGKTWPNITESPNRIVIEFTAGYASASEVPAVIRQAIYMICADMWANRESIVVGRITSSIPMTAEKLLDLERIIYHG